MVTALLLTLVSLAGDQFEVQFTDGAQVTGQITAWDGDHLTVESNTGPRKIPLEQISKVLHVGAQQSAVDSPYTIRLVNNDTIRAHNLAADLESVQFGWAGRDSSQLPIGAIRSIRLQPPSPDLDKEWSQMLDGEYEGDALVIRRSPTALDYLEGVIAAVSDDKVTFQYNGEEIEVQKRKLEGMVFFRPRPTKSGKSVMNLQFGSNQIGAASVRFDATQSKSELIIQLADEFGLTADLTKLTQTDFALGRVVYLSDTAPSSITITPAISSTSANDALNRLLYAPRMNTDYQGQPLQLDWPARNEFETYSKGIAAHSRTELTYALDGQFATLRGTIGLDPSCTSDANVHVIVNLDGQQADLFHLNRDDAPLELNIDVNGVRQMAITVDYGDGVDLGDRVHLCKLRVVK